MGILIETSLRLWNSHLIEQFDRARFAACGIQRGMKFQRFGDLRATRPGWIQRRHRFLKDHTDFTATQLTQARWIHPQDVFTLP